MADQNNKSLKSWIWDAACSIRGAMKQANLSTNAMKKLKVVLPDESEQSDIADCFKSLDQKIIVAERKLAALQDLFRTLLHELMTAAIRVDGLELEMRAEPPRQRHRWNESNSSFLIRNSRFTSLHLRELMTAKNRVHELKLSELNAAV